jgi:hypothetical protein
MLRILTISTLFISSAVLAEPHKTFDAEVKKAAVTLSINDASKDFDKAQTFSLHAGDIVCFEAGEGRVIIQGEDYKKQLTANNKGCKQLPVEANEENAEESSSFSQKILALFQTSKEESVDGVSRSVEEAETYTQTIEITPTKQAYLAIENDSWGPLPITLEIIDDKQTVIDTWVNEEDLQTSFIIPSKQLNDGYHLKISNMLGDLLLDSPIALKE